MRNRFWKLLFEIYSSLRYGITGLNMEIEKLNEVAKWYFSGTSTQLIKENFCKTRSEYNGRLTSYEFSLKKTFSEDCLFLLSSSLGEIGNNCFDHNLGFWQDEAGCLFIRENRFALICDRGRGIKESLSSVYTLTKDDKDFISIAFNKIITGRAPEKRGNGLKFVKKNILNCKLGLLCLSTDESLHLGIPLDSFAQQLLASHSKNNGVLTYIYW